MGDPESEEETSKLRAPAKPVSQLITSGDVASPNSVAPAAPNGTLQHFELAEEEKYSNRIQLFNAIAEQIWREQQLVSTRMQWNFTFQAFLAGIYVFAGSDLDDWPRFLVQSVLCVAGFMVALFCLLGVMAAQDQSTRLKGHWAAEFCKPPLPHTPGECNIGRGAFPQPFSSGKGSSRGRFASRGVCYALLVMWVAMAGIAAGVKFVLPQEANGGAIACQLKPMPKVGGDITIICKPSAAISVLLPVTTIAIPPTP